MAPQPDPLSLVAGLDATERGFVLGRLATLGLEPGAAEAPLAGPRGQRCAEALQRISILERAERLELMKRLAHELSATPPEALAALAPTDLLEELAGAGADVLGASLQGADEETLQRAMTHVGPGWADRVRSAAAPEASRALSRDEARELVAATGRAESPVATLQRLGAGAWGTRLRATDPALVASLTERLPDDLARRLLAAAGR